MKRNCASLVKSIDAYVKKSDNDLADSLEEAGFIDAEETVGEITRLEARVAKMLKRETKYIISALEDAVDVETFVQDIWPDLKSTDELAEQLRLIFYDEFYEFVPGLTSRYTAKIDPEIVVENISKRTTAWMGNWSTELGEKMKLTSHDEIETILTTCLSEGKSVAEATQAILDSGIRDEYYKARRVSVTEMLRAHSVAQHESFMQSPAVEDKLWIHTGSYRNNPRQNHVDMDGKRVGKSESFELNGADGVIYYPMYPRDIVLPAGESANCHCMIQPVISEAVLALPLEERQRLQAEAIAEDDGEWEKELDAKNKLRAEIEY